MTTEPNRVIIFDTTLRDGEQSPGCSMNVEEKLRVAEALEDMGVDVIEAGFPIASNGDFEAVREVSKRVKTSQVAGLARAGRKDIDRAWDSLKSAKRPRVHVFMSTSPLHMRVKLRMEPDAVHAAIVDAVRYARNLCEDVEFSPEDGSRTEHDFLCRVTESAIKAGARTINIPDTVGYAVPDEFAALIAMLRSRVPNMDKAIISVHCHNDLGLAVANSLAAVGAGARQVECTINGIGERAGNAAMEEIVMALRTRRDAMPYTTGIRTEMITRASRLLSSITGFNVQPNKAIVGVNAFAHEAGVHQDGVLKDPNTYEIMTPESIGLVRSTLVMGKHSGRHAFRSKLKDLGCDMGDNEFEDAFERFKTLADKKKQIEDEDIVALVGEEVRTANERIRLLALKVVCGTSGPQTAELELEIDGRRAATTAEGDGPVDATFKAIGQLVPHDAKLKLYQVDAVTEGSDAQAGVTVRLEEKGKTVNGQSSDTDTVVSSCRAYLHALNKLLVKREKTVPAALGI